MLEVPTMKEYETLSCQSHVVRPFYIRRVFTDWRL